MLTLQIIHVFLLLLLALDAKGAKPQVETYLEASKKAKGQNNEETLQTTNSNHNLFAYLNRKATDDQKHNQPNQIQNPNTPAPVNNYFVLGKAAPYGGAIIGPAPVYVPPSHREDEQREAIATPQGPKPVPIPLLLAPPQYQQGQHPQFLPVLFAPTVKGKAALPHGVHPNMVPVVLAPATNKVAHPQYAALPPGFQIFLPPHAFPPKLGDFPFDPKHRALQAPFHHNPIPFAPIPVPYRSQTDAANHPVLAFPLQFIPGSHYRGGAFISPKVQIPTGKPDKPVMVIPYARHISPPHSPNYFEHPKHPVIYDEDFDLSF